MSSGFSGNATIGKDAYFVVNERKDEFSEFLTIIEGATDGYPGDEEDVPWYLCQRVKINHKEDKVTAIFAGFDLVITGERLQPVRRALSKRTLDLIKPMPKEVLMRGGVHEGPIITGVQIVTVDPFGQPVNGKKK